MTSKLKISEIEKQFPIGSKVYKSNREESYKVVKYDHEKLFFSVPNHKEPNKPNIKSLHIHVINIGLMNDIEHLQLPFTDCRKSVLNSLISKIKQQRLQDLA